MSSFSLKTARSGFDVKWPHVTAFLEVLHGSELRNEGLIERRYRERATNYVQTVSFLTEIGITERVDGTVQCSIAVPGAGVSWKDVVVNQLLRGRHNPYRDELFGYLSTFVLNGGEISRAPDPFDPTFGSGVRNFLMEMGVVRHRQSDGYYLVHPSYAWLAALARGERSSISPSHLTSRLDAKDEIGRAAELAVVGWECRRLGERLSGFVQHVAETNAAAGFDVLSATASGSNLLRRFIEVKAVPLRTLRFYWTQNEVDVARTLGPLYYLYLVPVTSGGTPDVSQMQQIADPCSTVLSGETWEFVANVIQCQLRDPDQLEVANSR